MDHSVDARLSRIEEGLVYIHGKIDRNHEEMMKILAPISSKVEKHNDSILVMMNERKWIFTIFGFFAASGVSYLIAWKSGKFG